LTGGMNKIGNNEGSESEKKKNQHSLAKKKLEFRGKAVTGMLREILQPARFDGIDP